jgi:hypothetical protein
VGTPRQLHGGHRQADGVGVFGAWQMQGAYCRRFSWGDPVTSSGVAGGNNEAGLAPSIPSFQSFGQGSHGQP